MEPKIRKRPLTRYNQFVAEAVPHYAKTGLSIPDSMRASARDWYYFKKGVSNPEKGKFPKIGYIVLGGIAAYIIYQKFLKPTPVVTAFVSEEAKHGA